ncbi:MAG: hypothetical protein DYH08_17765 [Actinobacteria bacterium ATB1]|nr:hypothetical protein [Actinobacteria bacterium ATB1]
MLTRTVRGFVSGLAPTPVEDGVPTSCVVIFDNLHTLPRDRFRRKATEFAPPRLAEAYRRLRDATDC